jgi:asparagine synthase (glutamine-hydrolysing)
MDIGGGFMSAIAGIDIPGKQSEVIQMLEMMGHRGPAGNEVIEVNGATLGVTWTESQSNARSQLREEATAADWVSDSHFAFVQSKSNGLFLKRDPLGIAPLYYGRTPEGAMAFASEVKALVSFANDIQELSPGSTFDGQEAKSYYDLEKNGNTYSNGGAEAIAQELRSKLEKSIEKSAGSGQVGAWLSGGLDSSTMAALARPHFDRFYTIAAGMEGSPDLYYARMVADHIGSDHHETIVDLDIMLEALPQVIYHLESFDPLLVRSSITNFLVAQRAAEYVPAIYSGEGGDELFAGYSYMKKLDSVELEQELIDATNALHNTALQRVDRCASAHGTVAHVSFLDPEVVDFAVHVPVEYKLHEGNEKWILRRAVDDALPPEVVERDKAKFWNGAGVNDRISQYAEEQISDQDFLHERNLPNGWQIQTKEELFYYRIFKGHFGELEDLSWMGRTSSENQTE